MQLNVIDYDNNTVKSIYINAIILGKRRIGVYDPKKLVATDDKVKENTRLAALKLVESLYNTGVINPATFKAIIQKYGMKSTA